MTRQLSSEFKRECAELVLNYGYAHKDAAKTMNVSISSIQRTEKSGKALPLKIVR